MCKIYELCQRANVNIKPIQRNHDTSYVAIYEDHRTILNVLYFLKTNNVADIKFPIDIFMFDNHADNCPPSEDKLKKIKKYSSNLPTINKFWDFTEFDLCGLDDDWVQTGMQLGFINNVFLFHSTESGIDKVKEYKTRFGTKKIYNLGEVWNAMSILDSNMIDYEGLRKDIGWIFLESEGRFEFQPQNNFILDFDLDCFAITLLNETTEIPEVKAIAEEILIQKFTEELQNHTFPNSASFVKELIEKSIMTTICFEHTYCGGVRESMKIFNTIDYLFFDGEIGS